MNGDVPCVREYRTKAEVDAAHFNDALVAFTNNYSLANVLSLSPLAQETYWKLKNEKED